MSADDLVLDATEQRIRELARLSAKTADSARTLLASFRGLPGGTDSARAALVLGGLPRGGSDEAGFTIYEGFTCEGALSAAVSHLEYAERMLGGHARAVNGKPGRLAWRATDDPERLVIVALAADTSGILEVGWAQLIRHDDATRQWRACLTEADGGRSLGSVGDYGSSDGLIEALERCIDQDGPWWTARQTADRESGGLRAGGLAAGRGTEAF